MVVRLPRCGQGRLGFCGRLIRGEGPSVGQRTCSTESGNEIVPCSCTSNGPVGTLDESEFLGLTALTRQPNLAGAYAVEEVTALQIKREYLEQVVMDKPTLLQDLGRLIDERQSKVRSVTRHDRVGQPHPAG